MSKTAKIIFLFIGSIFPILVGALHLFVHFTDLVTPEIQHLLSSKIQIMGEDETLWNAWGMMSTMMGGAFIVIGLLNITTFMRLKKDEFPPLGALLAMAVYLLCSVLAGHEFEAAAQFYGGIGGLVFTAICILLCIKGGKQAQTL